VARNRYQCPAVVLFIAVWRGVADVELADGLFFDAPAGKIIPNGLEPVFI
jgi:hypothetical protein